MKIGILTYQNSHNFGALLQAKALKLYLSKIGYDVTIINYINNSIQNEYNRNIKYRFEHQNVKEIIKSIIRFVLFPIKLIYSNKENQSRFDKFEKYINNLVNNEKKIYSLMELEKLKLDFIICGSDQIWNPMLTNGLDPAYFAFFETTATKISYAASMGIEKLKGIDESIFKRYLNNFDYISVREEKLLKYCQRFTNKKITKVLDPTLLLEEEDYKLIMKKPDIKEKYLLVYAISEDKNLIKTAEEISKQKGLKLIEIRINKKLTHIMYNQVVAINPDEFLGYIYNASAVVTNSFHGTVFSLVFKKDFYVVKNNWAMSRIDNLLEVCGIKDRIILNYQNYNKVKEINYKKVSKKLNNFKNESIAFLADALKKNNYKPVLPNKKNCVGCSICAINCKQNAISMHADDEGFIYPVIDLNKCNNCGECLKVCPNIKKIEINSFLQKVYAVKSKSHEIKEKSQSGGVAYLLSKKFVETNNVVYGAIINENFDVEHVRIDKEEDIKKLCGSKYVQSNIEYVFDQIKKDIKNNKKVLFIGTACQVAAIKKYINSSKLFTCDILCHGVPSPLIYLKYLSFAEQKYKKEITDFSFRDKRFGWGVYYETLFFNKKYISTSIYKKLFESNNSLRPACYNCKYSSTNRISDITIGDCWGIKDTNPQFLDFMGVSLVLINSKNGNEIFSEISSEIEYIPYELDFKYQPNLKSPTEEPKNRAEFWNDYKKNGFEFILNKYSKESIKEKMKIFLKILKRNFKKYLR